MTSEMDQADAGAPALSEKVNARSEWLPRWDYHELAVRLEKAAPLTNGNLHKEAAGAIRSMMETNKRLHRRVQIQECPLSSALDRAKADARHGSDWAVSNFRRMLNAFDEIKRIYEHIRRARPDGCDEYGYHSVSDIRFDGTSREGEVWANRFISRRGGIISVRPAAVIGELIDELLEYRRENSAIPPDAELNFSNEPERDWRQGERIDEHSDKDSG